MVETNKQYPEYIEGAEFDKITFDMFEIFDGSQSYEDDYKNALEYQKKKGGVLYTTIDGEGSYLDYEKGKHFVNRLGYAIIKIKGMVEE